MVKTNKDGKVLEATKDELWDIWYKRGLAECGYDFKYYMYHCESCGVKITDKLKGE